jgi:hypothetical protein
MVDWMKVKKNLLCGKERNPGNGREEKTQGMINTLSYRINEKIRTRKEGQKETIEG